MPKDERNKIESRKRLVNFWLKHIQYGRTISFWQRVKDFLFPHWVTIVDKGKKYRIKNPYFKQCSIVGLCEIPNGEPLEISILINYDSAGNQKEEIHNYVGVGHS